MPSEISIHTLLAESDAFDLRKKKGKVVFLSTLSLRRATQDKFSIPPAKKISIHTLLAESDIFVFWMARSHLLFLSTLSLRRATPVRDIIQWEGIFLSTLSLRRATTRERASIKPIFNFYPHSPCGERLHYDNYNLHCVEISIHTLLAESDARRASRQQPAGISIHTLLAESDL